MGCSGCHRAKKAMQAQINAQKQVQSNLKTVRQPSQPIPQKTPRQIRIEARAARMANRNARMAARNAAILSQKEKEKKL